MNFAEIMNTHEPIVTALSMIIFTISVSGFIYSIMQLGKEENKDEKKRSKILSKLILFGLLASVCGIVSILTTMHPAVIRY